jgi:UDP-N-acetylmuramyl tripeptide synthase
VLAWNGAFAPGGWSISSWNCCRNGNQIHSDARAVSAGETISGYVAGSNCNDATGVCNSWQVRTSATNTSTTLNTDSYGEVLDLAFGGVLEAYNVTACNQYAASLGVTFQNVLSLS